MEGIKGLSQRVRQDWRLNWTESILAHCLVVVQSPAVWLSEPKYYSTVGSLSFGISQSLLKLMSIESLMPSNHLILCHPLLLLPSIFPNIRVLSSQLACPIRWPKNWSFSYCPMNSRGWFPLGLTGLIPLQSKGLSEESSTAPQFKSINSSALNLLYGPTLTFIHDYWKKHVCGSKKIARYVPWINIHKHKIVA